MQSKKLRNVSWAIGIAAVAALSTGGGVAVAGALNPTLTQPDYPTNSSGLTYGSAAEAAAPEVEPDLILAVATNGKEGYLKKTEFDAATGLTASSSFKSPKDAIAWQNSAEARADKTINVYDVDGKTVIGSFIIAGGNTQDQLRKDAAAGK